MKQTLLPILALALSLSAAYGIEASALLLEEGKMQKAWITAASEKTIEYKSNPNSVNLQRVKVASLDGIYFLEPIEFKKAMDLYRNRDFKGAQAAFAECKDLYKKSNNLPNNYSTLAGYYEIESARKLGDLETMAALLEKFVSKPLTREKHKSQMELYPFWDAVRTKSWSRLDELAKEWNDRKLYHDQRVQVAYCHALALEGLKKPIQALTKYNTVFVADLASSSELCKKACLSAFKILTSDPQVVEAQRVFGTKEDDPLSSESLLLKEAVSLVALWEEVLGAGEALPAEYAGLIKFKREGDDNVAVGEEAEAEAAE